MKKIPYHVFKKPKKTKDGKPFSRWYYYFYDENGRKIQKACPYPQCKNRSDAESYIRTLPPLEGAKNPDLLLSDIAATMYIPGSAHIDRRYQLGKSIDIQTMLEARRYIEFIIGKWGSVALKDIEVDDIVNHLFSIDRSGSWKNRYISILKEIYAEAPRYGCKIRTPDFPHFARNSKKADIFSSAELKVLFQPENFQDYQYYVFFLLTLSGGLRLGETRAIRQKQIIPEKKALIIDGFCKQNGERTVYNKMGTPENPKLRVVPLPAFTLSIVLTYTYGRGLKPDDFIFTLNNKPISKETAENVFYKALQSAGLIPRRKPVKRCKYGAGRQLQIRAKLKPLDGRKLVPHSLRYTYVSRMRRELSAADLQPMTGHTTEAMVDYYNRINLEEALAALPDADTALSWLLDF